MKIDVDKLRETLGERLRAARLLKGLSQEEVAHAIGVAATFYARMENGVQLPSMGTLAKLLRLLDASADQLLGFEGETPMVEDSRYKPSPEQRRRRKQLEVERCLREASPEALRLIETLLTVLEDVTEPDPTKRALKLANELKQAPEPKNESEADDQLDLARDALRALRQAQRVSPGFGQAIREQVVRKAELLRAARKRLSRP